MKKNNSYRLILTSTSIMGLASVANIFFGVIRMKVAAITLGPIGVGYIGLFQSLMGVVVTLVGLGNETVAVKKVADAKERASDNDLAIVLGALRYPLWVTVSLGAIIFFFLRDPITKLFVGSEAAGSQLGFLTIGIVLAVIAASQIAVLNGFRSIEIVAKIQVYSGLVASIVVALALYRWRFDAIVFFVVCAPAVSFVFGAYFLRKIRSTYEVSSSFSESWAAWIHIVKLGSVFMLSSLVTLGGHLLLRSIVNDSLGPTALGQLQASLTISTTYLAFLLGSMASDYYPRLSGIIAEKEKASQLVNEQLEVGLLLAGPLLVGISALSPLLLKVLYSGEFENAARILRWQIIGDTLKVVSVPLGFVLLSAGAARAHLLTMTVGMSIFVGFTSYSTKHYGIVASGIGYLLMYAFLLASGVFLSRKLIDLKISQSAYKTFFLVLSFQMAVIVATYFSDFTSIFLGVGGALILTRRSWLILRMASRREAGVSEQNT